MVKVKSNSHVYASLSSTTTPPPPSPIDSPPRPKLPRVNMATDISSPMPSHSSRFSQQVQIRNLLEDSEGWLSDISIMTNLLSNQLLVDGKPKSPNSTYPRERLSNKRAARLLNERFQQQPNKLTV